MGKLVSQMTLGEILHQRERAARNYKNRKKRNKDYKKVIPIGLIIDVVTAELQAQTASADFINGAMFIIDHLKEIKNNS